MTAAASQGISTKGYATHGPEAKFEPFEFARREVGPKDVLIDILYCGICHSDIHQARAEWEPMMPSMYPMVPGHEIVGRVSRVGGEVTKFKEGDLAGIGCFVDSCRECAGCTSSIEQYCIKGSAQTYNSTEMDSKRRLRVIRTITSSMKITPLRSTRLKTSPARPAPLCSIRRIRR